MNKSGKRKYKQLSGRIDSILELFILTFLLLRGLIISEILKYLNHLMSHFILSKEVAYKKLERMAYEIVERNMEEDKIILAGIKESGLIIANILYDFLQKIFKGEIIIVAISIDKKDPKNITLTPSINFDEQVIILIDDVSNSGKTLLYAMKPFLEFYPKKIQTLVLVERSYKEFPISPDYVGLSVATALSERIVVETSEAEILGATINQ